MRDSNKRKRESDPYYVQNVDQANVSYQMMPTQQMPQQLQQQTPQVVDQNSQVFNQSVLLNQPVMSNQQLLYQLQRSPDSQQQNMVYLLVPTNDNLQVQHVPVTVMSGNEQQIVSNQHNQQFVVTPQQLNDHGKAKHEGAQNSKAESDTVKIEYFVNDSTGRQAKNDYSYDILKESVMKTDINGAYQSAASYVGYDDKQMSATKEQANISKPHLYRCDYKECLESFYSLYEKKLHLDAHMFPESNEFKCGICNMIFEKALDRNKHVESHSIAPTYKCRQCQKDFAYYTVLIKHLEEKKCSVRNPVTCFFCEAKIMDNENLARHHQLSMKQCSCGKKLCGLQTYETHWSKCGDNKTSNKIGIPALFDTRKKARTKKT